MAKNCGGYIDGGLESGDWVPEVFEGVSQVMVFGWDFPLAAAIGEYSGGVLTIYRPFYANMTASDMQCHGCGV